MIEWSYAQVEGHCGGCHNTVKEGDPIQLTHIVGVKRALVRCEECAGPVPEDLPPYVPTPRNETPPLPEYPPPAEWTPYRDD